MKRVLILVLAAILIFAFAACANKDKENAATPTPAQTPTASPTMTATPPAGENGNGMNENGTNENGTENNNVGANSNMFTGTVSSINGRTIVVTPNKGEAVLSSGEKIEVSMETDHSFAVGDKVKVSYNGDVMQGKVTAIKVDGM